MTPSDRTASLTVPASIAAEFRWSYDVANRRLAGLYERSKDGQWSAQTDIDWSIDVPYGDRLPFDARFVSLNEAGGPLAALGPDAADRFRWEFQNWMVSQFLHGEQGAMVAAGRLVEVVPGIEAKSVAATQAVDEARHVEVFARYASVKMPHFYAISAPLESLLGDTLRDGRWDITQLGMHIMIEALAMAAFRLGQQSFHDPLLRDICRKVARDEARHVAFGILALEPAYLEMSAAELADREDFVLESAALMARRFQLVEIWEHLGIVPQSGVAYARTDPVMARYRQAVFAKVVTSLRDVGLLTPRVRDGLRGLGLLGPATDSPGDRAADGRER